MTGPPRDGSGRPPSEGPAAESAATAKQPVSGATVPDPCDVAAHVGRENAYRAGYEDGWAAGHEVGAGRVVDGVRHAFGDVPDLLGTPELAGLGERFRDRYVAGRAEMLADPDRRCPAGQVNPRHRCATCARVAAREENWRRWGTADFPPAHVRAAAMLRRLARTS